MLRSHFDAPATAMSLDIDRIRRDFPALHQWIHGRPLVYLDNAASAQKPTQVIERLTAYYSQEHSNVHRGVHELSQRATDAYEASRTRIAGFIGAAHAHEIIFTRGTTEAINLVAATYGRGSVSENDEIVVTGMEHHSNMVPWHILCEEKGASLRILPVDERGELQLDGLEQVLTERTKLIAVVHVSNSLGSINPVRQIVVAAHRRRIPVLVDGAQAAPHMRVNVTDLGCDFYCFSGHKVFGPTGIGILYGREALLEAMPPYQGGGDMIHSVTYEQSTYAELPHKFEAGTPHIAGALGLAAALDYVEELGLDAIAAYEDHLLEYAQDRLKAVPGLRLVGTAPRKAAVVSFLLDGTAPYDVGRLLDEHGIAVRTGHHCTMPLMKRLGISGTVRASFAFYNTKEDVDRLADALQAAASRLKPADRRAAICRPAAQTDLGTRHRELVEEFSLFDDTDAKCEFLMELGEALPPYPEAYRIETHRVHGCLSTVWLHTEGRQGQLFFAADSDALITKGMIAVLVRLLQGQPAHVIAAADLEALMAEIGMQYMVTARRKNGLLSMIKRIQRDAQTHAANATPS